MITKDIELKIAEKFGLKLLEAGKHFLVGRTGGTYKEVHSIWLVEIPQFGCRNIEGQREPLVVSLVHIDEEVRGVLLVPFIGLQDERHYIVKDSLDSLLLEVDPVSAVLSDISLITDRSTNRGRVVDGYNFAFKFKLISSSLQVDLSVNSSFGDSNKSIKDLWWSILLTIRSLVQGYESDQVTKYLDQFKEFNIK
ncbi:MAG: hypothetical protein SF123_07965 [Chloroflexota bacterium]|nr:hypothetical protein [Chloroflexota bacterium]